jgi:hypothetical protein
MSTFTYNNNIPATNNDPADDQPQMLQNYQSINSLVAVDHVGFNIAGGGYHKQVTIPTPLVSDPTLAGAVGEFYTKAVSGVTQAFFANATTVSQLTGLLASFTNPGYANLPGGLQVRFGTQGSIGSGGFSDVNFNAAFTNNCLAVVASCSGGTAAIGVALVNAAKFQAKSSSGTVAIQYIAVGY